VKWSVPIGCLAAVSALAGCGGSGGTQSVTVQPAATYEISNFKPSQPVPAGKPVLVSFQITQPDGTPLTKYKTGPGPHTGVHLIFVRRDLAYIVHKHPPVGSATIRELVTFPAPGPYRLVIDVYPASSDQEINANFQLFESVEVAGPYHPRPLGATTTSQTVDGYHFTLHGANALKAIQAQLVTVDVTGPGGKPATFSPWYGALAHAIFFRQGSLDYFHTHVCAPGVSGCTSILGTSKVTGTSATPGKLKVGVLVPAAGKWRLFLQTQVDGKVLTVPFVLQVR
jgi:hypothetical protein